MLLRFLMSFDKLAKLIFPRVPSGRRIYQLKVLIAASLAGLICSGILVAVMCFRSGVGK